MSELRDKYLQMEGASIIEDISTLDKVKQQLILTCKEHCSYSYSPYSNFAVGASLLLDSGEIIGGSNQENASYPLCICAEKTALAAASSFHPNTPILSIAVTAFKKGKFVEDPITPCGSCRQFIAEYAQRYNQSLEIIMYGTNFTVMIDSIYRLLPFSFEAKDFQ
jgi:cytidine deaminase